MSKRAKQNALSLEKLLAWVESERRKPEQLIGGENSFGHPDPISEFEGRIWAYKLVRQLVEGAVLMMKELFVGQVEAQRCFLMTGQLVCSQCYEFRRLAVLYGTAEGGRVALQRR